MTDNSANIALLIDADNASAASIDPVLTILAELGTVNVRRAYGNWKKPALKSWETMTLKHAIEPHQQFDITKGKNATDMKMTIDAMDLLFAGRVGGFGIMSSDSDFMPLAMRIKQEGLPVYGFGTAKTPDPFKQACTRFIDVAALSKRSQAAPEAAPAGASATAPAKQPVDDEVIQLLIDAYNAVKRDERGFADLSEVGQLAGNRSSFDARNYGYARLSELVTDIPNFQTEKRDNGQLWVKRLR
ncbi:MAG: NYN domain-containing protein [Sphingomonadaceae bacterium]|nr:NYN domain-containing protein [Sphingomonadaceae bacterium]